MAKKVSRRVLTRALTKGCRPPEDWATVLEDFGSWYRLFANQLGIVLIVLGIKFPSARQDGAS